MTEHHFFRRDKSAARGVVVHEDGARAAADTLLDELSATGIVLLRNLDPSSPEAILRVARQIGTLDLGIDEELIGPAVMDLRYDPVKITPEEKPAYFTSNFFPLHTDVSYVPTPCSRRQERKALCPMPLRNRLRMPSRVAG